MSNRPEKSRPAHPAAPPARGRLASPEDLPPRARLILREIVHRYIEQGVPVGSRTISREFPEPLSPATIRNIMADLEDAGFITHPHTSAGRVPTERGYRYYVDMLVSGSEVPRSERELIARGLRRAGEISDLLETTSHLLSTLSRGVGVVVVPELRRSKLRHVDFVKVGPGRTLVVLVSTAGVVYQTLLALPGEMSQDELDRCSRLLSERFQEKTLEEIRAELVALMAEDRAAYDTLVRQSVELGRGLFLEDPGAADVFVDGASNLLASPELMQSEKAAPLLRALEEKGRLVRILDGCLRSEGVAVRIGSETREPDMDGCAVIASTYRFPDGSLGNLGVIGPARMEYERVMGVVGAIADRLSRVLTGQAPGERP